MKKMRKITSICAGVALMAGLVFTSCQKGEVGPKGDAGATGLTGATGATGATGPQGQTGNANVQNYSITVSSSQWTYDNLYQRFYFRYSSTANSESAVLAYVISGSGKQAVPYYTCQSSNAWCNQYDMATNLFGNPPYIEFQYTNYVSRTTAPSSDEYFYLVIIPPALKKPNVDYTNYAEVKKAYNLKD